MSSTPKQPDAEHASTGAAPTVVPLDWAKGLRQNLSADIPAGFVAFLLALPLSLGIAQASGFPASMGIVTAVIGGLVATFFAGSRLTIKGPAAGLIVIIAGCVADFGGGVEGWHLALGVMVVAGLVQIAFGLLKWGRLVNFFPLAAVHGMLAAIGLIIIAKQVPVLLNVDPALAKGKGPIELLASIPEFIANLNPSVAIIGGISLLIMFGWPIIAKKGFLKKVPAPLIVLFFAIPTSLYLDLEHTGADYTLVKVGRLLDQVGINVSMGGLSQVAIFMKYVLMVAIVGTLESLLTVKAIDALDPYNRKSDPNKDLIAVGLANTFAAVLGGLPMISEVARSSANVASGAKTRWANFFHGVFLLIAALAAYQVLEMIPNAALAAMLIAVGVKLAHPKEFIHTYQIGPEQLAIFSTTVFFTLFEDLLIGIAAGIALKVIIHLMRGAPIKELFRSSVTVKEENDRIVLSLGKVASFTNYLALDQKLEGLPQGKKIEIDIAETILLDHSVQENLAHFAKAYRSKGGEVIYRELSSLQPISNHPLASRRRIGVTAVGELVPLSLKPETHVAGFDESRLMHRLHHYLPAQLALKDFVHHNTLHCFQEKEFFEGIFTASRIFGYQVTLSLNEYRQLYKIGRIRDEVLDHIISDEYGVEALPEMRHRLLEGQYDHPRDVRIGSLRQNWKRFQKFSMDDCIQPRLFRLLVAYLDQGVAEREFPFTELGLLAAVRRIEETSYISMLRSKRARRLLLDTEVSMTDLLQLLVGDPAYFEQYVLDQQFAHRGWSGLVAAIEGKPDTLFYSKAISLEELIKLELILEIDALDDRFGVSWQPLTSHPIAPAQDYFEVVNLREIEQVLQVWHQAFEWDYYDQVLSAVGHLAAKPKTRDTERASFQAVFCIDDRECSIRRHIEAVDADARTFGAPGHFGLNVLYRPEGGKFLEKNCPVPAVPSHVLREKNRPSAEGGSSVHLKRTKPVPTTALQEIWLSFVAAIRLPSDLLFPTQRADAASSFSHMHAKGELEIEFNGDFVDGLPVGYTIPEMADRVQELIAGMGAKVTELAQTVYLIGHGSSSANNPHYAAYDCGACSGRPGSVNARAFAFMANHREVRAVLESRGFQIPKDTAFIGGLHDTASDNIQYYDLDDLSNLAFSRHEINEQLIEKALERNARERARRFASISQKSSDQEIRKSIEDRTVKYFETRPELNHGSNALCYVGERSTIRGLFLDRRAFLTSYDPHRDPDGNWLSKVLAPLPTVCGGINLEYYFSRMDNEKLGAGTKLPHQIMGLVGVANSSDGDLRPGLHWQTVENHDPIRLMMLIEQTPEIILQVLGGMPDNKAWFTQGWIHLVSVHPTTGEVMRFRDGIFQPYEPMAAVRHTDDIEAVIRTAPQMASAHIVDATQENLPVHVYTTK